MQPEDWNLLIELAKRSGVAPERVSSLQRRWAQEAHPAAPLTLLAGHSKAIQLLLARWMSVDAAAAFVDAGNQPLVIGPAPTTLQPPLGKWAGFTHKSMKGHLIALAASDALLPSVVESLGSFGVIDQAVLVSFIDQPLNHGERRLASSLASIAKIGKCLVVALPGYEISEKEVNETAALARRILEIGGFNANRCGGTAVWFTEESHKRPGALGSPDNLLSCESSEDDHQEVLIRVLESLLRDFERGASAEPMIRALNEEDQKDAIHQFASLISRLGQTLSDSVRHGAYRDTETLRKAATDLIIKCTAGSGIDAAAMNYLETLRPGAKAGLRSQMALVSSNLDLNIAAQPVPANSLQTVASGSDIKRWLITALAGAAGYAGAWCVGGLMFQPWLQGLVSNVAGGLLAIAGWLAAGFFGSRMVSRTRKIAAIAQLDTVTTKPPLVGWGVVEQHLNAWFINLISSPPASIAQHCAEFRARFSLTNS